MRTLQKRHNKLAWKYHLYSGCSSLGKAHVSTCAGWEGEKVRSRRSNQPRPGESTSGLERTIYIVGARRWAKRTSRRAQGGRVRKSAVGPAWLPLHKAETQASFEGAFNRAHVWTGPGYSWE